MSIEVIQAVDVNVSSHFRSVRLYYDLWDDQAGEIRGAQTMKLGASETFGDLKAELLEKFTGKDFIKLSHRYELRVQFKSYSRLSKQAFVPHDCDSVLRVVEAEESRWSGLIFLVLADMRRLTKSAYMSRDGQIGTPPQSRSRSRTASTSSDLASTLYPPVSNLQFTTDWVIYPEEIDGSEALEKINQYVVDIGVRSGTLHKYQFCKDLWREESVVVDDHRIWFFQLNDYSGAYSYIDVMPNVSVFCENDSNVIAISNSTTIRRHISTPKNKDPGALLKLRAGTKDEALEWQRAIQFRSETYTPQNENSMILLLEKIIENEEKIDFDKSISKTKDLTQFEGMLSNRYLREQFRTFLETQYSDEFLKFWEYAEDYRRYIISCLLVVLCRDL